VRLGGHWSMRSWRVSESAEEAEGGGAEER